MFKMILIYINWLFKTLILQLGMKCFTLEDYFEEN